MNKYIFVADIAGDIDDAITIEWMHRNGYLDCVVLDGKSRNKQLEQYFNNMSVTFVTDIPEGTKILFCGGALTKIAEYVSNGNELDWLIVNGGFVGANIVPPDKQLQKFKNKNQVRTYNLNLDVDAAKYILTSNSLIKNIVMVSKNVCHSDKNTISDMHACDKPWIDNSYGIFETKRLHDLLMVKEGINIILGNINSLKLKYERVDMTCTTPEDEDPNMTKWGSVLNPNSKIQISTQIL